MFELMKREQLGELHLCQDPQTGLEAVVAIHSTLRGPALGGCRCINYPDNDSAVRDAARLARGMSYKAALANIAHGGGKCVILKPHGSFHRKALMQSLGDFIDSLQGRYITAVDSGTTSQDMDIIATRTHYVTSTTREGNPSAYTAQGVFNGLRAAVKHRLGHNSLDDVHVAIQGLGHVGLLLAQLLHAEGARLTVADTDAERIHQCCELTGATVVAPVDIHRTLCDVFSPCALGGAINARSLEEFNCSIIAGSANNQLAEEHLGQVLHDRDILYAPDYAINAGGLIYAALRYAHANPATIEKKVAAIGTTLSDIFEQATHSQTATNTVANQLAETKLYLRPTRKQLWDSRANDIRVGPRKPPSPPHALH